MKMTPSILLNIVLVTVLATSMFFISTTASTAEYNPWADIDGDGEITIYDVVKVTGIYGSSGDPTRNVTVTNFPTQQPEPSWKHIIILDKLNLTWNVTVNSGWVTDIVIDKGAFSFGGYNSMKIYINVMNYSDVGGSLPYHRNDACVQVKLFDVLGYGETEYNSFRCTWSTDTPPGLTLIQDSYTPVWNTAQPLTRIEIYGESAVFWEPIPDTVSCLVTVGIYLRNE